MSIRVYGSSTIDHPTWSATTQYKLLDFIVPTTPNDKCYECTNGGTSGSDEPSWNTELGSATSDGDDVIWTCRNLLSPNPLVVEIGTEDFGGYAYKDIWVKNSGVAEFIVYGSHDGDNWRQIDELNTPQGEKDNRHKGIQNAYRHIRVVVDSENESEIEIVAGV